MVKRKAFENDRKRKGTRIMLTEPTVPTVRKSTHDFALLVAGNVCAAGLSPEVESHYLIYKEEVITALWRGFVFPRGEAVAIEVSPSVVYKTADTDLDKWLDQAQKFTKKFLGVEVNLRQQFVIPETIPWPSALPVFDPGNLTNRDMVTKALKGQSLDVYEEVDVMKYAGSEANKEPTLHFIANSVRPDAWTLTSQGISPNQLLETGKPFLCLRGYGLAMALYHFAKSDYLDKKTLTWFPKDRLADGSVALGYCSPDSRQVLFPWTSPGSRNSISGARVAIPISLSS